MFLRAEASTMMWLQGVANVHKFFCTKPGTWLGQYLTVQRASATQSDDFNRVSWRTFLLEMREGCQAYLNYGVGGGIDVRRRFICKESKIARLEYYALSAASSQKSIITLHPAVGTQTTSIDGRRSLALTAPFEGTYNLC
jgi:hypothetical protein